MQPLAFREVQRVESRLGGHVRFAFRHFPMPDIHPHPVAAATPAEAAALQGGFWEMHETLDRESASVLARFRATSIEARTTAPRCSRR